MAWDQPHNDDAEADARPTDDLSPNTHEGTAGAVPADAAPPSASPAPDPPLPGPGAGPGAPHSAAGTAGSTAGAPYLPPPPLQAPPPPPQQPPAAPAFGPLTLVENRTLAEPPAPSDPLRAAAVALLNASGLGIGYAFLRRWVAMAVCWIATVLLLLVALPADPDGVSGGPLFGYGVFLALAAAHGAARGLRTRLSWPPRTPVAILLGLALLALPAGGVLLYDNARNEAVEQALMDRLDTADRLVQTAKNKPFLTAQSSFTEALATYSDLDAHHADSRAGKHIPDSLRTYYETIAAPYGKKDYCNAIERLEYLRKVPDRIIRQHLGSLAAWPDDRLATSLYECGIEDLGYNKNADADKGHLARLLATFPESKQAAKVEPALSDSIDSFAGKLKGSEPCDANDRLITLGTQASALPGEKAGIADALAEDADKANKKVQSGTYACGVDQYKDGDFDSALDTLNGFADKYRHDRNRSSAQRIAIAAEIAGEVPAAGRHLPSGRSGGSIPVTIENDSPDEIEILYTGPVTGSFKLGPCSGCTTYTSEAEAAVSACKAGGRHYPSRTIHLPAGTTYFLHKTAGDDSASAGTDTTKIEPGYLYTECAYVVHSYGSGYGFDS